MKRKLSSLWRIGIALVLVLGMSLVMAAPASAQGALTTVSATPANTMAGVTTTYTLAFTTATGAVIGSVDMEFNAAFDVSGAAYSSKTGIGDGTVSVTGQVVTYTVTSPTTVDAGTAVTIVLSGIVNPAAAAYSPAVTITTRYTNHNPIDVGTAAVTITALPASFGLDVPYGEANVTTGTAFDVEITALKADGVTTETNYSGTHLIDFSSTASDPKTIPTFEVVTFTSGVGGTTDSFVLNKVETGKTITATDSALSITGTSSAITFVAAALDRLTVTGAPTAVVAGVPFSADITVNAEDTHGNVIVGNTATVTWTSSDGSAVLPAAHALVAGTYTFTGSGFILKTAGAQTLTATEGGASNANAVAITVSPAAASKMAAANSATPITANGYASSTITATVKDAYDNTVTTSTATITFETSVGQFANGASTYSVAATAGVATAVLTSSDDGTATVKVTSGSLTYATTAVVLTPDSAPTVVWVDDGYSVNAHNDGHVWGTDAFADIEDGTDAVAEGGTVNVAPGTYTLTETINIGTAGITLQSTAGALTTIIDADDLNSGGFDGAAILINATGVTVDGFTVKDAGACEIYLETAGGATIKNNVITNTAVINGIDLSLSVATAVTVSGNSLDEKSSLIVHCSLATITGNSIGRDLIIYPVTGGQIITGTTVTNNTFPALTTETVNGAINIWGASASMAYVKNTTITGNTIANRNKAGLRIGSSYGDKLTIQNLTVTHNDIINNDEDGVYINGDVEWVSGNVINNNNIYGNIIYGINNAGAEVIDAENNWWGDASGPYVSTNAAATGDAVTTTVDYRPWLTAAYTAPVEVTTISLVSGWNLISLMLIPTNSAIATVLDGVTVDAVWTYDAATTDWASYVPGGPVDLTTMVDGKAYWVEMSAAATLTVAGLELAVPPATPPTYDVVVGWNLIGFKSTTPTVASTYLAALGSNYTIIYAFDAASQAYVTVQSSANFEPGKGYWIAITAPGTIYP